jgi:hypothetical protein
MRLRLVAQAEIIIDSDSVDVDGAFKTWTSRMEALAKQYSARHAPEGRSELVQEPEVWVEVSSAAVEQVGDD